MSTRKNSEMRYLQVALLRRGQFQTRQHFDQAALQELADSFQEQGIIQPLVVRPLAKGEYEIVAGERRWRAAQLAALHEVPCLVCDYSDEETAAVTTIENLQRADLNPIEEANAFKTMINQFGHMHEEVALLVGKSRVYISNSLRLLKLDSRVQALMISGDLLVGHAKVLAGLPTNQQYDLASRSVKEEWSVRKLERVIKSQQSSLQEKGKGIRHGEAPDIRRLERVIGEQVGTEVKVDVTERDESGWLKVKFYDADTLAGLLERMGVEVE